ncbi:hypothetical protein JHK82_053915 [Glycine max]|nr:hypothetical protein JHK86_053766 [Glycine max]KAG4928229.1 hypothetical protein JHK85_054715 [Glycine max]KAG5083750.1 hypothetical protein JHK84_053788 [Glycine max]KAG5086518.1 hypothetical protein JHK82_053915 [Glycine max]KHN02409.1 Serine/threonine-protein kinase AFC1-like protein [Glycine soja]
MEANAKIKKYEETVKHLYKLLKKVCQERDEARGQLQLIRNFQASTPAETSSTIPQVDHPCLQYKTKPSLNSTKVSNSSSKVFSNHPCDLSLSSLHPNEKHSSQSLSHTRIAEPSNLTLTKQPNHMKADIGASRDNNMVDGASLVFDKLVCGKPLPQIGRLLQSVTEAGPLLQTLLVAPAPQWQNPPSLSSSGLTLGTQDNSSSTNTDDKANVNPNGFIPTSLGLVFPGNSHVPSQMSYASGFGLALKNELVSYVFEKLGPSLYDFLRKNNYRSLSIDLVREFGRQLLESVAFMHHTDLKPENILLVSSEFIKVPDYKGEAVFQTHENLEHLAMMERVLEPLPPNMVVRVDRRAEKYFKRGTRLSWPDSSTSRESMRAVWKLPQLPNLIRQHVDHSAGDLIDLLQGLLRYDPSEPLKAKEAMRHHFFFTRDTKRYGYPL